MLMEYSYTRRYWCFPAHPTALCYPVKHHTGELKTPPAKWPLKQPCEGWVNQREPIKDWAVIKHWLLVCSVWVLSHPGLWDQAGSWADETQHGFNRCSEGPRLPKQVTGFFTLNWNYIHLLFLMEKILFVHKMRDDIIIEPPGRDVVLSLDGDVLAGYWLIAGYWSGW